MPDWHTEQSSAQVFHAAWRMAGEERRSSMTVMLRKWLTYGPPWRVFLQSLTLLLPATASQGEPDLSGQMASLYLQDTAESGKQAQHQLEDGEIIVETGMPTGGYVHQLCSLRKCSIKQATCPPRICCHATTLLITSTCYLSALHPCHVYMQPYRRRMYCSAEQAR